MPTKNLLLVALNNICCCVLTAQQPAVTINFNTVSWIPDGDYAPPGINGSPLLLKEWAKGTIINHSDSVINDTALLMNYNKLSSELIVTRDMQNYLHADRDDVKAFTLNTANGSYSFYRVPEISNDCFFLLIASGKTCTVYKKIATILKKADYHNDGIVEGGSKYNQYLDNSTYYVMDVSGKTKLPGKFYVTKKSVKNAFSFDTEKSNQYFEQHAKASIDDDFIKGLADYINQ